MSKTQEALKLALDCVSTLANARDWVGCTPNERWDEDEMYAELCNATICLKKSLSIIQEALAEQPAQQPVSVTDELVNAYCEAWKQSFLADNAYHTVSVSPQDRKHIEAGLKAALAEQPAQQQKEGFASPGGGYVPAIPRPMPPDWKLVPRKATPEMLKAMDECAQEGYDERLYAGMASSVYMAAWDASPVMGTLPEQPAQQEPVAILHRYPSKCRMTVEYTDEITEVREGSWPLYTIPPQSKPLTDEEIILIVADCASSHQHTDIHFARAIEAKLKEKNNG